MKYGILMLLIISTFFFYSFVIHAAGTVYSKYTNHGAPEITMYQRTFDHLVMDVSIPNVVENSGMDHITAIGFSYQGTATRADIIFFKLWEDQGEAGWQGLGVDRLVAHANFSNDTIWYVDEISIPLPKEGVRIFISTEISSNPTDNHWMQAEIGLSDKYRKGVFDVGDEGIYVASGNHGPQEQPLRNPSIQILKGSARTLDVIGPKANISDPKPMQHITTSYFTVVGVARDQGDSSIDSVRLRINEKEVSVVNLKGNYETWKYEWKDIPDGEYRLTTIATDSNGNTATSERVITVTVDAQDAIFPEKSLVVMNRTEVIFGESARVDVTVMDEESEPYPGAMIQLKLISGPKLGYSAMNGSITDVVTDANGKASLLVFADDMAFGKAVFQIVAKDKNNQIVVLGTQSISVIPGKSANVTPVEEIPESTISPIIWSLIKFSHTSAVYLVVANIVHPIPSAAVFDSWGLDWKAIQTKSEFLPEWKLGKPLPFRDGTLIKGTESAVSVVTSYGKRAWITTEAVFLELGYQWPQIRVIDDSSLALYPRLSAIDQYPRHPDGTLVQYLGDARVYFLQEGKKRWINSEEAFIKNGFDFKKIISICGDKNMTPSPEKTQDLLCGENYLDGSPITDDERAFEWINIFVKV